MFFTEVGGYAFWLIIFSVLLLTIVNMLVTSFEAFVTPDVCTPKTQLPDIMNQIDHTPKQVWEKPWLTLDNTDEQLC